jgi:hypothetical protein
MRNLLIGLFILLLPGVSLASGLTADPVGTCRQIKDGYWQQMPDGTWASPGDKLNTCAQNGFVWNFNNQNFPGAYASGYNPTLANMSSSQFLVMCVLLSSLLPQSACQGFNPTLSGYGSYGSGLGNLLRYPQTGRNYIAIGGDNSLLTVSSDDNNNFWKTALIGVGMGWLLNQLTS